MALPSYAALQAPYAKLWATLVPTISRVPALTAICRGLIAHKATYQEVSQTVWGKPDFWFVVALLDQMEGGGGANTFLGNGQSLHRMTTEEPLGEGPFASFHEGAARALHIDGLDKVTAWPASAIGYWLERYNGTGYMSKPIVDPYLASWSNKYTKGKYIADHVYDPNAVSQQPGALTILKVLLTLDPTINVDEDPKESPVTAPAPAPAPAPVQIDPKTLQDAFYAALAAHVAKLEPAPMVVHAPPPVPVPAPAQALPQIDLASTIAHLDMLMPIASLILSFIPQAAPFVPVLATAQKLVHAGVDIQAALKSNPASLGDVIKAHMGDVSALLHQGRTAVPQLGGFADVIAKAVHALAPPAPAAPIAPAPPAVS